MHDAVENTLYDALAVELDAVRVSLEGSAVMLCLDPLVFERHPESLQSFDRLAQTIGEIANVLRDPHPHCARQAIRLDDLRQRLSIPSP